MACVSPSVGSDGEATPLGALRTCQRAKLDVSMLDSVPAHSSASLCRTVCRSGGGVATP